MIQQNEVTYNHTLNNQEFIILYTLKTSNDNKPNNHPDESYPWFPSAKIKRQLPSTDTY